MSRTYGHLNEYDSQILATNHKSPREAITKEKLAFEVAKLVKCCIQDTKVRTTFVSVLSFSKPILVGRVGMRRHNFGELGVGGTGPRVESALETSALVRRACLPCWSFLEVRWFSLSDHSILRFVILLPVSLASPLM